ncbi:MFS transporter [Streptomyces sp. NPDC057298]|uniref:MFS transporter n=1 Tax=Streptomyces sp. NPDC057298 TaxID=3346091 RepID=UPI0036456C84
MVLYTQLCVFGFANYGFSPSIPLLARDHRLADSVAALHSTAVAVGAIAAGWATARAVARFGRTRVQSGALLSIAGAVVGYCAFPWLWGTLLAAAVLGCAGNAIVNVTTAALADHHGRAAPAAISEANGLGVGVGMLAPLMLGVASLFPGGWRVGLLLTAPAALAVWFLSRRRALPSAAEHIRPEYDDGHEGPSDHRGGRGRQSKYDGGREGQSANGGGRDGRPVPFPVSFWTAWSVFILCSGFELCMSVWASRELVVHAGLDQPTATMGVTTMLAGMVAGRLGGAGLAQRFSPTRLLICSIALALAGFALFWTLTGPAALAGALVCGLGMSLHFPLAVSRALDTVGGATDAAMSRFALGLGLAVGISPFALSALAGAVGIHLAFLIGPTLLLFALALSLTLGRTPIEPTGPDAEQPVDRVPPRDAEETA